MTPPKEKHKISIIIPAYNEEKYLPRCLDSISQLDWPKEGIEVIVIDNGSTDKTCEIARSHGALLLKDDTKNVSGLRNLGAASATGDILAFVDADCIVSRDWLTAASKYFEDDTVAAWGAPPNIPDHSTWVQKSWFVVRKKEKEILAVEWLESMNLFVKKKLFMEIKGFDEALITCEDVDFSYRLSRFGRIMADSSIKVIHLGEAASVNVFFKKELWRGKGNFHGILRHGFSMKELPSVFMPVYFGLFLPLVFVFLLFNFNFLTFSTACLCLCLPGILGLYKIRKKNATILVKIQVTVLMYVYFSARTLAVFNSKEIA